MDKSAASVIDAIIHNLSQPETCTCGITAPSAVSMEEHLRVAHNMGPDAYPPASR